MSIIENRKAYHNYSVEDRYEAGIILHGWEVIAIRAGRGNIQEAYVQILNGEIVLIGSHISPLLSASTHVTPDPLRTRKLLLHKAEIKKLIIKVSQAGYTLVPLDFHYKDGRIKVEIALGKGKNKSDKRASEKDKDGKREVQIALKQNRK